eukprot:876053-Heterocapsa_arctica.AAC.1
MDTGAAGASDSTGGAGFPPAGPVPATAAPPPVPGLKVKVPSAKAKPPSLRKWTGTGKAPPTPPPAPQQ